MSKLCCLHIYVIKKINFSFLTVSCNFYSINLYHEVKQTLIYFYSINLYHEVKQTLIYFYSINLYHDVKQTLFFLNTSHKDIVMILF